MLEASAGGGDGERLVTVQQFAPVQGGLAEPHTHLSTFSNTVSPLNTHLVKRSSYRVEFGLFQSNDFFVLKL